MATFTHKKGDDLEWVINLTESGAVADVTSWTITCHVRQTDGTLIQSLTVTKTDPTNGVFSLTAADTDTVDWPLGDHNADIEFVDSTGAKFSTATFNVVVIQDITIT